MSNDMGIVGIEIGTHTTVMSRYDRGRQVIDIVQNLAKDKTTPTIVCWPLKDGRDERQIGLSAQNQMNRNLQKTFQYFTRFLGLDRENFEDE